MKTKVILTIMAICTTAFSQIPRIIDTASVKPSIIAVKDSLKAINDSNYVIKKQIAQLQDTAKVSNEALRMEVKKSKSQSSILDKWLKIYQADKDRVKLDISEIKKLEDSLKIARSITPVDSSKTNPKPKKRFRIFTKQP